MTRARTRREAAGERIGADLPRLETLLRRVGRYAALLPDRDLLCTEDLRRRVGLHGERTYISERQRAWLVSIEQRLDASGAPADPGDTLARPVDEAVE